MEEEKDCVWNGRGESGGGLTQGPGGNTGLFLIGGGAWTNPTSGWLAS